MNSGRNVRRGEFSGRAHILATRRERAMCAVAVCVLAACVPAIVSGPPPDAMPPSEAPSDPGDARLGLGEERPTAAVDAGMPSTASSGSAPLLPRASCSCVPPAPVGFGPRRREEATRLPGGKVIFPCPSGPSPAPTQLPFRALDDTECAQSCLPEVKDRGEFVEMLGRLGVDSLLAMRLRLGSGEAYRFTTEFSKGDSLLVTELPSGGAEIDYRELVTCDLPGKKIGLNARAFKTAQLSAGQWRIVRAWLDVGFWPAQSGDRPQFDDAGVQIFSTHVYLTLVEGIRGGEYKTVLRSNLSRNDIYNDAERQALADARMMLLEAVRTP